MTHIAITGNGNMARGSAICALATNQTVEILGQDAAFNRDTGLKVTK